ncbi:ribosomal-protein-S5-alanine N-acetyltransferase [Oxobacter pfennigii]|uniref:Ribosomal-protein-S5-alanine N-acetyltransferase n=1 Tax=Oxobacter pfennigii TaxID=36849 RepID=A0A0P8X0N5_9CLOT|nr:GNAT family N-acetyltransferase [Oxobacter pfennigii]KPU44329.1 ribosomal-protein-S5-alanine N-acetyltransferase [Oxobacter pfennigii]
METERIRFSKWTDDDFSLAVQLWGKEDVTRYICASGKFTEQDIQKRLNFEISNQKQFNVQYWPIFGTPVDELIGCCGLRPFKSEENSYEIGFHLRKKFWGQGYAFEAAASVIKYGFTIIKADKLFAGHHPQNMSSKKLLLRLGFKYIGDNFYEPTGLYHPSYEMCNCSGNARWVTDGKFYTSSGVSAGMDMALEFIAERFGIDRTNEIADGIEYNWNKDKNNDPFAR